MSLGSLQYYPTPPNAGLALMEWMRGFWTDERGRFENPLLDQVVLDPAAGRGALPWWLQSLGAKWHLYELWRGWEEELWDAPMADDVMICNSLEAKWPEEASVIANPPYGKALLPFVDKIHAHCRENRTIGAILTPAPWWGEGDRGRKYQPDHLVWMTKRLNFDYGARGVPTTHVWAIYLPIKKQKAAVHFVHPPPAPDDFKQMHRKMCAFNPFQIALELGG